MGAPSEVACHQRSPSYQRVAGARWYPEIWMWRRSAALMGINFLEVPLLY
jgi:hypothetical protein